MTCSVLVLGHAVLESENASSVLSANQRILDNILTPM